MNPAGGRALVLGNDTRAFLSVIRSLGRAGVEVHAAWAEWDSPALRSRYLREVHEIPRYSPRDERWLEALTRLLRETRFDAVIPCHDAAVLAIHRHRGELGRWTHLCIPNESAFEWCFDKRKTYELAERLSIPLPKQSPAGSPAEIEDLAGSFGMPLVLKPAASVSAEVPDRRNVVRKVRRLEDIEGIAGPMLARGPLLVQQNFVGSGVGVEVLCKDGEILAAFQHERVHEAPEGGGGAYRKSVPLSAELLKATRRLMNELRYTGVAMAEFKVNPRTGGWVLIEINGRFWGSLPLTIAAGADFPRYLYELMVHGRTGFPREYRTGSLLPELAARPGVAEAQSSGRPRRRHAPDGAFVESRAGAPSGISGAQRHVHAGRSESRGLRSRAICRASAAALRLDAAGDTGKDAAKGGSGRLRRAADPGGL